MDLRSDRTDRWPWLPWVLLGAFALRVAVALNTETVVHPDEALQYLEQGHRLAYGVGVIPWEYEWGVRSWIIPGFIAVLLEALRAVGLDRPEAYDPAIKVVFCAISLSLPLAVYRITRLVVDERAARIALVLASVWYELVYYAHKPVPDALGVYALLAALPLGLQPRAGRLRALAFGALCGVAIVLRFQLIPLVAIPLAIAVWRWRGRASWAGLGLAIILGCSGALDAYTWGVPFSSIWINARLNLASGVAQTFGAMPADYYLMMLTVTSLGLAFAGWAGLWLWRRTAWPLILLAIVTLAAFSVIGHKEPRFVFALMPLYLIGLGALAAWRPERAPRSALGDVAFRFAATSPALALAVSLAGLLGRLPFEQRVYMAPILARDDVRETYRFLGRQPDLAGVIDQAGDDRRLFGYFDLHRPAPLYRREYGGTQMQVVLSQPALYASHWIRPAGWAPPPGWRALTTIGRFTVWRRDLNPARTLAPPGYSTRIGFPALRAPIEVTPRW